MSPRCPCHQSRNALGGLLNPLRRPVATRLVVFGRALWGLLDFETQKRGRRWRLPRSRGPGGAERLEFQSNQAQQISPVCVVLQPSQRTESCAGPAISDWRRQQRAQPGRKSGCPCRFDWRASLDSMTFCRGFRSLQTAVAKTVNGRVLELVGVRSARSSPNGSSVPRCGSAGVSAVQSTQPIADNT